MMKKLLIILFLSFSCLCNAQKVYVDSIRVVSWTIPTAYTVHVDGHKTAGAVVGGSAGYLIFGGPIAVLAGAVIGSAASSEGYDDIRYYNKPYTGYYVYFNHGNYFRTLQLYHKKQLIDLSTITPQ